MPRGNESPIGTERTSANGYRYRKIEHGHGTKWELIHRIIAEEQLGRALANDEYATFVDGDKTNLEPSNVVVRKRGQASLRTRLAQIEARIAELTATRDDIKRRLGIRDNI